ncbi:gluconate 2-dehydrogenase subunit 3-like protein [Mariniflexile fucanivorans]|uniref:Gluconate 2-dehydrogenase subunit 3-like protein n=1 Tax=Mariniflexile fucanivorans TaxID=264023 RepID=A0A4V2QEG1_9FLAO|nr:gluconate 2-dehydrogenase subunit 3 family protein [Mariniflexile fucanivorans]TCL67927.1 gluconate 2-dehydrogenase subunit 3-like protein [Mariniflexile fucanivorans]
MNRRKALGSILGLTGIGIVSYVGLKYVSGNSASNKGQLPKYLNLIAELVDVIIPPTETPGAKEAKVQDYIVDFMESCASNKEYNNFFNGLNDLQETCLNTYDASFENCTMEQKMVLLEDLDNNSGSNSLFSKINNKLRGRSFFNLLKTLTIEGYCTSELGTTVHLNYAPVPGKYEAITTINTNQKAWATR